MTTRVRHPTVAMVVSDVLLTVAGVLFLFVGWQVWWTDVEAGQQSASAIDEWRATIPDVGPVPEPSGGGTPDPEVTGSGETPTGSDGDGLDGFVQVGSERRDDPPVPSVGRDGVIGVLHVPRWGSGYEVPVMSGTSDSVLDMGAAGHYASTQMVGEVGNAGLAGHRTSYGRVFHNVHLLRDGDAVIVETVNAWLVYRVIGDRIVAPDAGEVLDPVPPVAGSVPGGRHLTLTTCDPVYANTNRYITWTVFDSWTPKSEGVPPAMREGV